MNIISNLNLVIMHFAGFGQPTTTTSSLFGQTSQTGGLFGSKPIGTGSIFGATTTTASTGFGTTGGLFGQTSATVSAKIYSSKRILFNII